MQKAVIGLDGVIQKAVFEKSLSLSARANSRRGLLSLTDISILTGFEARGSVLRSMLNDPTFPDPTSQIEGARVWRSGDVFDWIDSKRQTKGTKRHGTK